MSKFADHLGNISEYRYKTKREVVTEMQPMMEQLFKHLKIAVVFGGDKNHDQAVMYKAHNSRSWKSYEYVARDIQRSLKEIGFQHVSLYPSDMTLADSLKKEGTHLVWLNTGGVQGYNPVCHTPAMLEMFGVPYIGENPVSATVLDSKHLFKQGLYGLEGLDIFTSPFITWDSSSGKLEPKRSKKFQAVFKDFEGPFIVKPVSGRASLHVHKVDTLKELPDVIEDVYQKTRNLVLVEKYLSGREYCVAIAGKTIGIGKEIFRRDSYFAFSHVERIFDEGEEIFTSMDKKAITNNRARLLDAKQDSEVMKRLDELCRKIYGGFFINGLVRLDIREDNEGNLNILEVNPKPDLKKSDENVISLVSMGLHLHGMTYNDLIYSMLVDRLYDILISKNDPRPHISDLLS